MSVSTLTGTFGPHSGISTRSVGPNAPGAHDGIEPFYVYPEPHERQHAHPWHDCKARAEEFEADQEKARELLMPRHKDLGDDVDDPGVLNRYYKHRLIEHRLARYILEEVVPWAREQRDYELVDQLVKTAYKMHECRQAGPLYLTARGGVGVRWESKCSLGKYCPDEARRAGRRASDRYGPEFCEHKIRGGRVYKGIMTVPNYAVGRLKEGNKFAFKRFRDRLIRAVKDGSNAFGIEGALVILEAPLSHDDDWNIHLNVVLLTRGWLDFEAVRESWGFWISLKEHDDFSDSGIAGLINEMVKYPTLSVPEKSSDDNHNAPAMIEWSPLQFAEWFKAMRGFHATRSYGSLHGIGAPDNEPELTGRWLGRIDYQAGGYKLTWRPTDLHWHAKDMLQHPVRSLMSLRGKRSTTKFRSKYPTGPP